MEGSSGVNEAPTAPNNEGRGFLTEETEEPSPPAEHTSKESKPSKPVEGAKAPKGEQKTPKRPCEFEYWCIQELHHLIAIISSLRFLPHSGISAFYFATKSIRTR